ncbi:hypothetical protein CK203_027203 [Vitis vinifera]|uniref:Uncharacterized protein n=1 Tax=Vitis vinifera TaxID=29760 RepID=A0A438I674_VITVI|nr:hypothetical protein CK203_027203 [Vitis vinifera]
MTALLVFTGLNVVLASTITPVYDFVCFLPYWERRWLMMGQTMILNKNLKVVCVDRMQYLLPTDKCVV